MGVVQVPTSFTDGWDLADPLPPGVAVEDFRKMLDERAAAPGELLSDRPVEHETATEGKAKISTKSSAEDRGGRTSSSVGRMMGRPSPTSWSPEFGRRIQSAAPDSRHGCGAAVSR